MSLEPGEVREVVGFQAVIDCYAFGAFDYVVDDAKRGDQFGAGSGGKDRVGRVFDDDDQRFVLFDVLQALRVPGEHRIEISADDGGVPRKLGGGRNNFSPGIHFSLFEQFERGIRYLDGADGGHAAMVDGAFAAEARAAFDGFANDARERTSGTGGDIIGGAKDRDGRDAQRGRDVHRSGVVREINATGRGHFDEFAERGFAGEVPDGDTDGGRDRVAELALVFRSEDGDARAGFFRHAIGGFGETLGEPSLGGAVCRAGAYTDYAFAQAESTQAFDTGIARGSCSIETNQVVRGHRVDDSGAAEEFEVIETLVFGDVAGARHRDRTRQQRASAIARVSDALWNSGDARDGGGFEGVLEEDCGIEMESAKFACGSPFLGEFGGGVGYDAVAKWLAAVEVRDPGFREDRNFGVRKTLAQGTQCGEGHDGIADPVGGAHQNSVEVHAVLIRVVPRGEVHNRYPEGG